MATPGRAVFFRDVLFNLASVVDWQVANAKKQRQVDIDNVIENAKRVMHDYAIVDQVCVKMIDIYCKIDYKKQGTYIITEVFISSTVQVQLGKVNGCINIRLLKPHFNE